MIQPYVFSFCLVGIQSLIIECGEFLLHRGHSLCALISDDEKVQSWALSHQISCFNTQDEFLKNQHTSCDYLFSINNFSKLTLATLNKANKLAINFHDGILPHYSGLNPTSWAIINNEKIKLKEYIDYLLEQYFQFIKQIGFDKKLIIDFCILFLF